MPGVCTASGIRVPQVHPYRSSRNTGVVSGRRDRRYYILREKKTNGSSRTPNHNIRIIFPKLARYASPTNNIIQLLQKGLELLLAATKILTNSRILLIY